MGTSYNLQSYKSHCHRRIESGTIFLNCFFHISDTGKLLLQNSTKRVFVHLELQNESANREIAFSTNMFMQNYLCPK